MVKILEKELTLSASPITYYFILFGFLFLLPGYPILCAPFFVTLGIFKSFQNAREANDFVFSALLPIAKRDVVKGKYIFSCLIEVNSLLIMAVSTLIRMSILKDNIVYRTNALMNANLYGLGAALAIFGLFNLIFLGGFFKTAYKFGSFVGYIVAAFLALCIFESLHYIPGMGAVNAFGFDHLGLQLALFTAGGVIYLVLTWISYRNSCAGFDRIDL